MRQEIKKNPWLVFWSLGFFCFLADYKTILAEEIPNQSAYIPYQGKQAKFTSKDGTEASVYISNNQLRIGFSPVGKGMYSFPFENGYFLTGKGRSGNDRSGVADPTGFFYQDKEEKNSEFVLTTSSYGGLTLSVFVQNGHVYSPVAFCPPNYHWGVKSVERKYSETLAQDYFVLTYSDGKKDAYYVRNHFLILGNGTLLKAEDKPRTHESNILKLNSYISNGDWVGALATAKKKSNGKNLPVRPEIVTNRMIQTIDVEKGDYDEAVRDYFKNDNGQYNEKGIAPEEFAKSNESVGDRLVVDGKLDEAREFYQKAITNYQAQIDRIKSIEANFLKPPLPQKVSTAYIEQKKAAFAHEMDGENSELDTVKEKIEMIDEQK